MSGGSRSAELMDIDRPESFPRAEPPDGDQTDSAVEMEARRPTGRVSSPRGMIEGKSELLARPRPPTMCPTKTPIECGSDGRART
jgi:hypothetical protein